MFKRGLRNKDLQDCLELLKTRRPQGRLRKPEKSQHLDFQKTKTPKAAETLSLPIGYLKI